MVTFISLLRGINVSGQNRIPMAELKELYAALGFTNVVTYVQSGNVVFDCAGQDAAQVAARIEAGITRTFGHTVRVLLRDQDRFRQLVQGNPFTQGRNEDPARLHVTFLAEAPAEAALSRLAIPSGAQDEFVIAGQEVYLFCPNGYGRTKLSNDFFERKLGVSATTRNWKTVCALHELAEQRG